MIIYPNAKINLGLAVTGRRADGYHTIESIFCPIDLCDALELEPNEEKSEDELSLYGFALPHSDSADNLVMHALRLFRKQCTKTIPPCNIALLKAIPFEAGLGGGSSDAAFMLRLLNNRYNAGMNNDELSAIAVSIGADCSFFLHNVPSFACGIGEEIEPLPSAGLSGRRVVLVKPPFGISTPEAYRSLGINIGETRPGLPPDAISALRAGEADYALPLLENDFESYAFAAHPQLADIRRKLLALGAYFARMSGSGTALYGLFHAPVELPTTLFPDCFVWQGRIR